MLLEGSGKEKDAVSEKSFVDNLKVRFQAETVYTNIGDVVISVNPFKTCAGLYGPEAIKMYRGRYYYEVPPHLFALTDDAFRNLTT